MLTLLCLLLAAHAVADYPLQGDWLSKAKNHMSEPVPGNMIWPLALLAHASIHGAFVGVLTGSLFLGLLEFVLHTVIDYMKCDGRISYNEDQVLHYFCKVAICAFCVFCGTGTLGTPLSLSDLERALYGPFLFVFAAIGTAIFIQINRASTR